MRRYIGIGVVAALSGAGCWFFGLDVVPSVVVALVVGSAGIALHGITPLTDDADWPPAPQESSDGARREASQLSWAIRGPLGVVSDRIIDRVRTIAANSLRRRHLDLYDPADRHRIERAVSAPLFALLVSTERDQIRLPALSAALDGLERLEKSDPA